MQQWIWIRITIVKIPFKKGKNRRHLKSLIMKACYRIHRKVLCPEVETRLVMEENGNSLIRLFSVLSKAFPWEFFPWSLNSSFWKVLPWPFFLYPDRKWKLANITYLEVYGFNNDEYNFYGENHKPLLKDIFKELTKWRNKLYPKTENLNIIYKVCP